MLAAGCGADTCPPPPVSLPAQPQVLAWIEGRTASVPAQVNGADVSLLLDTGFGQTALTAALGERIDLSRVELALGAARAGPMPTGLLFSGFGDDGIVGADVLHQLPLRFDARARTTEVLPRFAEHGAFSSDVRVIAGRRCAGSLAKNGASGPFALLLNAFVDGRQATFVLDTGAQASAVRTSIAEALSERPRLTQVMLATGFAGPITTTATRAQVRVADAQSSNAVLLYAAEIDRELDRLGRVYTDVSGAAAPIRVDGLLGWSYLREFSFDLTRGASPVEGRGIRLSRFEAQDHWTRDFVGIGIYQAPSAEPAGVLVTGFYGTSPASGVLEEGDVIVKANGEVLDGSAPLRTGGTEVVLEVLRKNMDTNETATHTFTIPVQDLLPDPPTGG